VHSETSAPAAVEESHREDPLARSAGKNPLRHLGKTQRDQSIERIVTELSQARGGAGVDRDVH